MSEVTINLTCKIRTKDGPLTVIENLRDSLYTFGFRMPSGEAYVVVTPKITVKEENDKERAAS